MLISWRQATRCGGEARDEVLVKGERTDTPPGSKAASATIHGGCPKDYVGIWESLCLPSTRRVLEAKETEVRG